MAQLRVLIADDHGVLRAGLRMLLSAQPDMIVVGESADVMETLLKVRETAPDVLLLDISMPGPRCSGAISQIRRESPKTRILVLTMHDDPAYLRAAMMAGASGYVVKKAADSELVSAIRAIHRGRTFVDLTLAEPGGEGVAAPGGARAPQPVLSRREKQVLGLLARGHTNQEIADQLAVSVKTVETYRTRLGEKLGLHTRAELYRFAAEAGLVGPDPDRPRRNDKG